jgi:hypothetical protein
MTGKTALEEMIRYGWMVRREDGMVRMEKMPPKKDFKYFLELYRTIVSYTVPIGGEHAPMYITSGEDGPMFRWSE